MSVFRDSIAVDVADGTGPGRRESPLKCSIPVLRRPSMNREDSAAVQACRSLYDLLLLPVQRSIRQMNVKELTIVAHDIITLVPFSALVSPVLALVRESTDVTIRISYAIVFFIALCFVCLLL